MSSAEWISLASVIVAGIALGVSGFTYYLQKRAGASSDENAFYSLIEEIEKQLGTLNIPHGAITPDVYATSNAALGALHGLAVEAKKTSGKAEIEPDWYQSMILAFAFSQVWDLPAAIYYWERAVRESEENQNESAQVRSLLARGAFFYNRNHDNDWQSARGDFSKAVEKLHADPNHQGIDMAAAQIASTLGTQAGFELWIELGTGGHHESERLIADAFEATSKITALWRRQVTLQYIIPPLLSHPAASGQEVFKCVTAELSRRGVTTDKFSSTIDDLLANLNSSDPQSLAKEASRLTAVFLRAFDRPVQTYP